MSDRKKHQVPFNNTILMCRGDEICSGCAYEKLIGQLERELGDYKTVLESKIDTIIKLSNESARINKLVRDMNEALINKEQN